MSLDPSGLKYRGHLQPYAHVPDQRVRLPTTRTAIPQRQHRPKAKTGLGLLLEAHREDLHNHVLDDHPPIHRSREMLDRCFVPQGSNPRHLKTGGSQSALWSHARHPG